MRVKAVISYDGSAYLGFQKQTSTKNTITTKIEEALKSLNIESSIVGSGRTDAGVHATGQVIHFDIPLFWTNTDKLKLNLNRKLKDIYFKYIMVVDDNFHARFGARERVYRYVFKTKKPSIFEQKYISYYQEFNSILLLESLQYFEGIHNFNFFHKTGSITHTTIREIYSTNYKNYNGYHFIYFKANGFLRSQVRMMVEVAMQCARGDISTHQLKEQLDCTKKYITKLAPPEGLYLAKVIYK